MTASPLFSPALPANKQHAVFWSGLTTGGDSLAIASAMQNEQRLFVIVTPDNQTAFRLERELTFFLSADYPILHFPDWETLPYDVFSPLPEIISERLSTLAALPATEKGVLVVSVATLMLRLSPREHVLAHSFSLTVGGVFNITLNRVKLESVGYQCVSQVLQHAEFAVRGSIVDLFPMGSKHPYRIELFDDEIASIRTFDPHTQLSLEKVESVELLPAREFPFTDATIKRFRQAFRQQFPHINTNNTLYQDVSKGIAPSGIEYYLPLFVEQTETLFDYLPDTTVFVLPECLEQSASTFFEVAEERFQQRKYDNDRPLLKPATLFLSAPQLTQKIEAFYRVIIDNTKQQKSTLQCLELPDLSIDERLKVEAKKLLNFLQEFNGSVLFSAETAGHQEQLIEKLSSYKISLTRPRDWQDFLAQSTGEQRPANTASIMVAPLDNGLLLRNPALAIITEQQLSGNKIQQRRKQKSAAKELENVFSNLNELSLGSPVVHQRYGVGRYQGLQLLTINDVETEFLTLHYANDDTLYVPVSSLHLIGRYSGANAEHAPLHKLGTEHWNKAKKKALQRAQDVAAQLLDIHAKRAAKAGHAFTVVEKELLQFAAAFPFETTPDQQAAIDALYQDMLSPKPMDRVICGDVGFGKTEVAMRAAFIALQSNKQVIVLVPTTLLAQQHYQNFRDRFANWPVRVEVMSRFVTAKQQKIIAAGMASGHVDIVIGTHKLLAKTLSYKNLGLAIIDEEHRFGVRQKEHFKKLRHELDLLTLTATPIPRTLNMAMAGLRDISIIATPPPNRHPIKTFTSEWIDAQVQEACQREIKRGGQIFFLHNDVKSIANMAQEVGKLVPEARIKVAHGQMAERELEQIMLDFYHQRFNLLLSTTIIESGIDIPTANTIIINRADKLGLAQLHQLRGRVGRSHHRAYAYCIVPPKPAMSKAAIKRLEAFSASAELGAGFVLSSHDMDIRGAGELLGDGQSGQIQEIGFTLYTQLLERAVSAIKSGKQPELEAPIESGAEVDLQAPALIPADYLPDVHARLVLYKRIANTETTAQLRELKIEMIDRFGLLPATVKTLLSITALKQLGAPLGIKKVEANAAGGRIIFNSNASINTEQLITLIQTQPHCYKLDGATKLKFSQSFTTVVEKIAFLTKLLTTLTPETNHA